MAPTSDQIRSLDFGIITHSFPYYSGFGTAMSNAQFVIMWPNHDGRLTLSHRSSSGHVEPKVNSNPPRTATQYLPLSAVSQRNRHHCTYISDYYFVSLPPARGSGHDPFLHDPTREFAEARYYMGSFDYTTRIECRRCETKPARSPRIVDSRFIERVC